MRSIRALIYGLPILLLLLAVASFICVKNFRAKAANQLVVGEPEDATMLDPVLSSDKYAQDVETLVFNGLVKLDENLQIVGDLAKSWEMKQTTIFFFANHQAAQTALQQLEAQQTQWNAWGLVKTEVANDELRLALKQPGKEIPEEIASQLAASAPLTLTVFHIDLKNSAHDVATELQKSSQLAGAIKRVWFYGDGEMELTYAGDETAAMQTLKQFFAQRPDLEAKIVVSEKTGELNEPEIIFHLRKNVRWHDGAPFTSHDVAFTFQALMDPNIGSPNVADFEWISKLTTPDAWTVDVVYRKPFSPALLSWSDAIVPAHILEGKPVNWWGAHFDRSPIGTGPFKFAEWKTGDYIKVVRNDDYFEGKPTLDSIVFRCIPDPVSLRLAFETGQTDMWAVDPWAVGNIQKNKNYALYREEGQSYSYIGWNLRRPMFADKTTRIAIAHAINVKAMIDSLLYGFGEQSQGIFPPQLWFANRHVPLIDYDPAKAKQMLAEAGWKPGADGILVRNGKRFSFNLMIPAGSQIGQEVATLTQADLKKVGIEVSIQPYEWTVFLDKMSKQQDFDSVCLAWDVTPDYDTYAIWSSTQTHPGQLNFIGYQNPQVDRLLDRIRSEYDSEKIKADCQKMQRIIYDDQPYLFLFSANGINAMWKDRFRVHRPVAGGWKDEPVRPTKAGFNYYEPWFYRPEYPPRTTR